MTGHTYLRRMKQTLLCTCALVLFSVAGCGNEASEAAPPDAESQRVGEPDSNALAALPTGSGEPEIGDRIPEPQQTADPAIGSPDADGVTEIAWEDLMPDGEEERLAEMYQAQMASLYSGGGVAEGSAADQAIQIGTFNTVPDLDGMTIRLPGYTVPFDYGSDAEISEFLLVPYYGACLHAPPPPPNQTVFVKTDETIKLKDLSQAVWIEGTLKAQTQTSSLADAAYTIEMTGWEIYEY